MGIAQLRTVLIDYKESLDWNQIGRSTVAIDAYNAIYQFLSGIRQNDGSALIDDKGQITSHLSGILFRTANYISNNILPVYVFDGKPPIFKQKTIESRRISRDNAKNAWETAVKEGNSELARKYASASTRIDKYIIDSSKELLTALGINWIQAPEEGEAQAAYMSAVGDVDYAVSQDYDSLLFGAKKLLRNMTVSGKRRHVHGKLVPVYPERFVLDKVLTGLNMSQTDLIYMALLMGTDYNDGIPRIGPKTALKIVKEGKFTERIQESQDIYDPNDLIDYFLNPPIDKQYKIISNRYPNVDKVIEILCEEHGFNEKKVYFGLDKFNVKRNQSTLDTWF